jgi:ABC-type microcin C transport system duplicated ATPase subunit YejF
VSLVFQDPFGSFNPRLTLAALDWVSRCGWSRG